MAVESENVQKLMEWLADGGTVRASYAGAEVLVETLARLVFAGERGWAENTDQVDVYRYALRAWFEKDNGHEHQFIELTGPEADPGVFIDWFLPVLNAWEELGTQVGPGEVGLQNPNWDGTPGTEFYRYNEATQEYSYADRSDSVDWLSYEQCRYSEPVRDENYGLEYRYDNKDQVYEWHDEATGTWKDQAWADQFATHGEASSTGEPGWDEDRSMFYRVGADSAYEFADALTPGDRLSGCGDLWLSHEQVLARDAENPMAWVTAGLRVRAATVFGESWPTELSAHLDDRWGLGWEQNPDEHKAAWLGDLLTEWELAAEPESGPSKDIEAAIAAEVAAVVAEIDGAEELTAEELDEIRAELVAELISTQTAATSGGV